MTSEGVDSDTEAGKHAFTVLLSTSEVNISLFSVLVVLLIIS